VLWIVNLNNYKWRLSLQQEQLTFQLLIATSAVEIGNKSACC